MNIGKTVSNLWNYHCISLMPQVDPEVMKPIIRRYLIEKSGFSAHGDALYIEKLSTYTLRFTYSSVMRGNVFVTATISAAKPRAGFEEVDVPSLMQIDMFKALDPEVSSKLNRALENIVENAGIGAVTIGTTIGLSDEDRKGWDEFPFMPPRHLNAMYARP